MDNIVLIGFMGSGKSTVGKVLAQKLGWSFIDTDTEIERVTGLKIANIFKKYGEIRFRSEEALELKRLEELQNTVISTGGGIIDLETNWEILTKLGTVVFLYAPLDLILQRTGRRRDRPQFEKSEVEVERLWEERQEKYSRAEYTIDTTVKNIDEIVDEIADCIKEKIQ